MQILTEAEIKFLLNGPPKNISPIERNENVVGIIKQIDDLSNQLISIQDKCDHQKAFYSYGSDTGNWCSSDDSYWIDLWCPICRKRWRVNYDSDEGYNIPEGAVEVDNLNKICDEDEERIFGKK